MTDQAGPDLEPEIPGCTDVGLIRSGVPRTYRCRREATGEAVTALVYPVRVDSSTAATFTEQVAALGRIDHPQAAPVLDAGLADGFPYVISTPDAGTLAGQVQDRLRSPAELALLGRSLAAGLAAIHAAGLIHGGLTPDAVVFAPDGGPMLSGLTLGLGQHTGQAALSSPRQLYLAPETLRDGTTTAKSDLYALGAVLHTAISGQPPLAAKMGETAGEHILRVLHEPPARLEVLPDRFADVLAALLEKDPARRPQDAEAVAASLAGLQPEPTAFPAGGVPLPVMRRVPAAPPPESSGSDAAAAETPPSTVPEGGPAAPQLPRPALMNRGRLRSWPPAAPAAGAGPAAGTAPDSAPPVQQPVEPRPSEPRPDAPRHRASSTTGPTEPPPFSREPPAMSAGTPDQEPPPGAGATTGPEPHRHTNWLLVSAGVAVAAALIALMAFASRQDNEPEAATPTAAAQRPSSPRPTLPVRLDPPADHDTYVDLSWSGDPDLNYVVVVAQVGKAADTKLVYKRKKHRVAVVPGVQYCFVVQATDGINTFETEPRPIRDAQCEK